MSVPTENTECVALVIGEFPAYHAGVLQAEANAQGISLSELCAGILRAHVAREEEGVR